jgi:branched-chain amino acid transport system substrate-binding protein
MSSDVIRKHSLATNRQGFYYFLSRFGFRLRATVADPQETQQELQPGRIVAGYKRLKAAGDIVGKIFLQFLIVVVGIVIFDPIKAWWVGPAKYTIYLVGWTENDEVQKMFRAIEDDVALAHLTIDGKEVIVAEESDGGDPAAAGKLATELARRDDTLLVIGHVLTQSTLSALPSYMAAEPPVPVIATRETHPDLLKKVPNCKDPQVYCPFMPMSPTDTDQAQTAVEFALSRNSRKFLIVKANKPRNEEYAANLVEAYQDLIREKGGDLVATTPVTDQVTLDTLFDQLDRYSPDCLFFIGPVETAAQFLRSYTDRITSKAAVKPAVIEKAPRLMMFSDSAVGAGLLTAEARFAESMPPPNDARISVFVTFPLSGEEYRAINNVYGDDAVALVRQLLKKVEDEKLLSKTSWLRHLISMHRVRDARRAVIHAMEANAKDNTVYDTPHRKYQYFAKYSLHSLHFHIWRIEGQKTTEADVQDGSISSAFNLSASSQLSASATQNISTPFIGSFRVNRTKGYAEERFGRLH